MAYNNSWLCRLLSLVSLLTFVCGLGVTIQNPFDVESFPQIFIAGKSSLLSWTPTAEGTVTLKLFAGASREMRYVSTIAHYIDNKGSFTWTPSIALEASGDYALLIISDADDQLIDCSPFFTIKQPVLRRQEDVSSFMSDFGPPTTFAAATTEITPTSIVEVSIPPSTTPDTTVVVPVSSPTVLSPTSVQTIDTTTNSAASSQAVTFSQAVTSSQAGATSQAATSTQPATATQAATQSSGSSGLSTGAAIGIGVGATLLVLALLGILICVILRRRRQKRKQPSIPEIAYTGPAELAADKSKQNQFSNQAFDSAGEAGKKTELQGGRGQPSMAELSSPPPLNPDESAELEGRRRTVELQGQSMGNVRLSELQGQSHPRAELEALRAHSDNAYELSGRDVYRNMYPGYMSSSASEPSQY